VQATIRPVDGRAVARLGWMVGTEWQSQGFASEAATALVKWVRRQGVEDIGANIHPEHDASATVATRAGLHPTEEEFEGERVWRAQVPSNRLLLGQLREDSVLVNAEIAAIVPVSNVEKAVEFYGGTLGLELQVRRDDLPENREAEFRAGDGTLVVYESVAAGQSRGTVAGFRVQDLDSVVAGLRERGVAFEEYDLPDLKTENGIAMIGDLRASWARDPDGNIIAFEQGT